MIRSATKKVVRIASQVVSQATSFCPERHKNYSANKSSTVNVVALRIRIALRTVRVALLAQYHSDVLAERIG